MNTCILYPPGSHMVHILQLSPEVLIEIFSSLFLTDILRCKQTCRTFSEVVSNSVRLTYQTQLQKAGMLDNPYCSLSLVDKLQMLKDREIAWATLDHRFISTVQVPYPTSGMHDLTPGVFLLGREMSDEAFSTNGLQSVRLPSRGREGESTQWNQFDLGMRILEFRPAIEEHDMIAFVVMAPNEERVGWVKIMVVLRQHSDLNQAPAAALKPDILVCNMIGDIDEPTVGMEIGGENIAVVVISHELLDFNKLFIFNWKTGEQKRYPQGTHISICNPEVVFLREDILLHPCSSSNALLIFHIPQASCYDSEAEPRFIRQIYTLGMPTLNSQSECTGMSVRSDPACTSRFNFPRYAAPTRPFINDPSSSIIVFDVEITSRKDDSLTNWVTIVHRKALLDFMDVKDQGECGISEYAIHVEFSWHHWSPSRSRLFRVDPFCAEFTMNCAGQRYVQLTRPGTGTEDQDRDERHNTIHLFDFNPFNVKFMAMHGPRLLTERHSVVLNVIRAEDQLKEKGKAMVDTEGIFEGPLEGNLPYVELIIDAGTEIDYDTLFMDEERLIGIRTEEDTYRMKSLDVIYFG